MNAASSFDQRAATPIGLGLRILVALNFTDTDGPAFDQAATLALRAPRSELHLVHVFDAQPSADRSRDLIGHLRLFFNEKVKTIGNWAGMTVGIHLRAGETVPQIVRLAREIGAQMIVTGSEGGFHWKHWLGVSTTERIVQTAGIPVLVAGPRRKTAKNDVPAIEPPCPDCIRARAATAGKVWWCDRHSHAAAGGGHVYSYQRELPLTTHDSEVIPTGIAF